MGANGKPVKNDEPSALHTRYGKPPSKVRNECDRTNQPMQRTLRKITESKLQCQVTNGFALVT